MPGWLRQVLSGHYIERGWHALALLLIVASVLELAACVGLAYVAGFTQVQAVVEDFNWRWLAVAPAAWAVSYVGYYFAYRGVFHVQAGRELPTPILAAVALAGFGGFLAYSGGSLDAYALRTAGAEEREVRVRVAGLAALEQGALALLGCGVSVAVLLGGMRGVPAGASIPWAVAPVPGFLIAFWLADRYRNRFSSHTGWHGLAGTLLHSVQMIRQLFAHPVRWGWAIIGMAVFWAADAIAAWAGLASFGVRMNLAALFIGFASGMLFTRRTGPLAGAGILALLLPLTISYCGVPFAVAVAGVFAYRMLSLWLPTPAYLAVLPTLRKIGDRRHQLEDNRCSGPGW